MTLTALNRPLTDLGGFPVLWDSDVGTLVQDPSQGGTNMYGPGDLFRDPANGDTYQLQSDGSLALYRAAVGVPTLPPVATAISSSGRSFSTTPPSAPSTPSAAITPTGNASQWAKQAIDWLSKASFIGGVPNGVLALGGYVGYTMVKQRRRH